MLKDSLPNSQPDEMTLRQIERIDYELIFVCKRVCRLLGGQRRRAAPKSLSSAAHQTLVSLQNYQFFLFGVFLKLNSPTETAYLTLIGTIG
jgi:hypothetical protein